MFLKSASEKERKMLVQCVFLKVLRQSSRILWLLGSTEKRKLVDEAGFTVPHQRASGPSIKRTG